MALWQDIRAGIRDIATPAIAAVPISLLFGALAVGKGMSPLEVCFMSAAVFAGSAQFAALELWGYPLPVAALVFSTLLINARHILMSASLTLKTEAFQPWQRFLGFYVMADENWAMAERRAGRGRLTPAYYFGMSVLFWGNWVFWSMLGAVAGSFLGDPKRIGADFAFTALFIGLIAGFWRGRSSGLIIGASALGAAGAWLIAGPPWHVAAGALAGIAAAYAAGEPAPADAPMPSLHDGG